MSECSFAEIVCVRGCREGFVHDGGLSKLQVARCMLAVNDRMFGPQAPAHLFGVFRLFTQHVATMHSTLIRTVFRMSLFSGCNNSHITVVDDF